MQIQALWVETDGRRQHGITMLTDVQPCKGYIVTITL